MILFVVDNEDAFHRVAHYDILLPMSVKPITKLRVYKEASKQVLSLMDQDLLTPDRAEEILGCVSTNVATLETEDDVKSFAAELSKQFPELASLHMKFSLEEEEGMDDILKKFIDEIFSRGDMALAADIMQEVEALQSDLPRCLTLLKEKYPSQLEAAQKRI